MPKIQITLQIDALFVEQIDKIAKDNDRSRGSMIRIILAEYLSRGHQDDIRPTTPTQPPSGKNLFDSKTWTK